MTVSYDLKLPFVSLQLLRISCVLYFKALNACGRGCQGMNPRTASASTQTSQVDCMHVILRLLHTRTHFGPAERTRLARWLFHSPFPMSLTRCPGPENEPGLPISSTEPEYFLRFSTSEKSPDSEIAPPDLTRHPDTPHAAPEPEARRRDEHAQRARCGCPQ